MSMFLLLTQTSRYAYINKPLEYRLKQVYNLATSFATLYNLHEVGKVIILISEFPNATPNDTKENHSTQLKI